MGETQEMLAGLAELSQLDSQGLDIDDESFEREVRERFGVGGAGVLQSCGGETTSGQVLLQFVSRIRASRARTIGTHLNLCRLAT